jgi:TatD DNase family protein
MGGFYDTHAHLHFPDFAPDLPEVISRAAEAGITRIITIGTDFESSRQAIGIAERFEMVFAVVGWHPSHVLEAPEDIRAELREMARHPKVVALGETGLDYYRLPSRNKAARGDDEAYKRRQAELFRQHLETAAELGLNCVVHQRESFDDCVDQIRPFAGDVRTVFHCFSGTPQDMDRVLELGSLVSFTGIITFKNAMMVRESLAAAPSGKFMFETDCPYLAPVPYRGKRCEPAYVRDIAALASEVRQCSIEELGAMTCGAADGFFVRRSR